jgi:hypothetical protein
MASPLEIGGAQLKRAEESTGVAVTVGAAGGETDVATVMLLDAVSTPAKPVPSDGVVLVFPPNSTT